MTKHDAERKRKILDHIAATLRARGYPPSVREIARAVGLASTSAVHHHLQILERDGLRRRQLAHRAAEEQRLLRLALREPGAQRLDAGVFLQPLGQLAPQELALVVQRALVRLPGIRHQEQQAGAAVRFDLDADTATAEVRFWWKIQFDIERTGQTDLIWDQDGHLVNGVVTLATFDPKGRPMTAEDMRVVALHEVGHLIGLDHSPDSSDIMYPTTKVRDLSPRDVASALLLYQLAPGSLR